MKVLNNIKSEMSKVKWPDKKYMVKYSVACFSMTIVLALYFYGLNVIMALLKGLR